MPDYIKYIDDVAIKLADLAYEIGDFNCAAENYSKALDRLYGYNGDQMQPIWLAGELKHKLESSNSKILQGKPILQSDFWSLTKSSFVKGNQCIKSLYLDKHKRSDKNPITPEKQTLFSRGHSFEDAVRNEKFPGGINVKEKVGNFYFFNSYTRYLIDNLNTNFIYEASIIEDSVLVMCDVLVKRNDDKFDIYEIKMNTEINDAIHADLAIQFVICKKRFGEKLGSFNLILRVNNEKQSFKIIYLTEELNALSQGVEEKIQNFKKILEEKEPTIPMGEHCVRPYECDFTNYCRKQIC